MKRIPYGRGCTDAIRALAKREGRALRADQIHEALGGRWSISQVQSALSNLVRYGELVAHPVPKIKRFSRAYAVPQAAAPATPATEPGFALAEVWG